MSDEGFVDEYPCKCSGGDTCYIVRHPDASPPPSYTTRRKAESALKQYRKLGKAYNKEVYPLLED